MDENFITNAEIVNRIKESNEYNAVIGTIYSSEGLASAEILVERNIPFFVPTATNPDLLKEKSSVVPLLANDYFQTKVLAKYTTERIRPKTITILTNNSKEVLTIFDGRVRKGMIKRERNKDK